MALGDVNDSHLQSGDGNVSVGGHLIIAGDGVTIVNGQPPVEMPAVDAESTLGRYLHHLLSRNRYLQLQGIRSGGRLVQIELDQIYITLRATAQRAVADEERWLAEAAALAPGEKVQYAERCARGSETAVMAVNEAMAAHPRLVILGDPGSGKTTVLRYLCLLYARDLAEDTSLVRDLLGLEESGHLPILLQLRQIGAFLHAHKQEDDGTDGHGLLVDFLFESLRAERIELPQDFFDPWLSEGRAVILLDGLDEVADPDLRRRVSRLVESFTQANPDCRYVFTSRIVGYTGAARLGEGYSLATVRDFTMDDVEKFLTNWHRSVSLGQMGAGESADAYAADQTRQLLVAIRQNERIRELAINPLMLTVIAMVHRDRVQLPDRRAELYAEAVDVLLGKWDEARGVKEIPVLEGATFDTGDKRLLLQKVALQMHERQLKEVPGEDLRGWLSRHFADMTGDQRKAERAVERFLGVIEERTGLLVARGEGVYAFSHLTFQEYLAALGIAAGDDYVDDTLQRVPDPWWREVILLEAGHLSTQSPERTTRLIQTIADLKQEPEPYHNLVLAADCLRDVGANRVKGDLEQQVRQRLRKDLEIPPPAWSRMLRRLGTRSWVERRIAAMDALVRAGAGYWSPPHGDPEWVEVPAGEFWMGGDGTYDGKPPHQLYLDTFLISRTPITQAQYLLFVRATDHEAPEDWEDGRPSRGRASHPVVNVSWHDAMDYCRWLSETTGKQITLPSEAEWEKAARGSNDRRAYPWGDSFDATCCNCDALGLGGTTPVGIFPSGASPYGCLDMAGNVWEWTRSRYVEYPYDPDDGCEDVSVADDRRVLRGGSFNYYQGSLRCAYRLWYSPGVRYLYIGFRVLLSPFHFDL